MSWRGGTVPPRVGSHGTVGRPETQFDEGPRSEDIPRLDILHNFGAVVGIGQYVLITGRKRTPWVTRTHMRSDLPHMCSAQKPCTAAGPTTRP